jgi:hypothetical protein
MPFMNTLSKIIFILNTLLWYYLKRQLLLLFTTCEIMLDCFTKPVQKERLPFAHWTHYSVLNSIILSKLNISPI